MPISSCDRPPNALAKSDDGIIHYLENDAYQVAVDPSRGGLIRRIVWKHGKLPVDLLYSPKSQPQSDAGIDLFGCWPLVPFANRCFGGRLIVGDKTWSLPINDPASGNTMHGFGWQRAWLIEQASPASMALIHRCSGGFGPYRYQALIEIKLSDDGIQISLSVVNEGDEPAPFGLGLHPWFPCDARTELLIGGAFGKVAFASGYHPLGVASLDPRQDFIECGVIDRPAEIAVNYVGWRGAATFIYPQSHRLVVTASPSLSMPLLWRPPGTAFVCFEPQSHVLGAPADPWGASISPLSRLARGEALSGWIHFEALNL